MSKLVFHLLHDDSISFATVPALAERINAGPASAEDAFRARGIALESAAAAFPRFAREAATIISF